MKWSALLLALPFVLVAASSNPRKEYIEKFASFAVSEMKRTGVPASITLAQGILESNAGQSALAREGNNHFGVKCHKDWTGRKVYKDAEKLNDCFRAYPDATASFRDHSDFIRYQDRYKFLFDLDPADYKGWARGLKKAGYATDPDYPSKLIRIIEEYELYKYDSDIHIEVETPHKMEAPVKVEAKAAEEYHFPLTRQIYTQNGAPFIYAIEGETMYSIAGRYGLFRKEILKYNDLDSDVVLKTGEMVFLGLKKSQTEAGVDKYVVGEKESVTLRDISQRFGVKLQSLKNLNSFAGSEPLEEGDTVRLR